MEMPVRTSLLSCQGVIPKAGETASPLTMQERVIYRCWKPTRLAVEKGDSKVPDMAWNIGDEALVRKKGEDRPWYQS